MKRNRATPKPNPKKICTSENEKNDGRNGSTSSKDTLRVFCRVRPLQSDHEVSCITIVPPNKIQVKSPDANRVGNYKETQYTFKSVFDQTTSQHDIFMNTSYDLVKSLINGKNGLLFAYGITGSGKTYTMNGTHDNVGIMPRCLDVLFNSIHGYQPRKYVFKPDRMNGFDVQSEPDAMLDRQRELSNIKTPSRFYRKESDQEMMSRKGTSSSSSSETNKIKIDDIVKENSYAVFVTYVEIYNNSVYDLMEEYPDDMTRQRPMQPKLIREDGTRNMYVHAVTEVEVQSAEEAFDVYSKGQKRRRLAYTALNTESSRSHSVFTIRLVQAPLNLQGDLILKDRAKLNISQLSLVDLAGSERTSRTKTAGQRLREAGSINNSLLTLRTCLEILRENQLQGTNKMVPYRESRLTHLFKNYFDGEGDIRMIVCINPRTDDYDETLHVLKFSEMSQEVQINRPVPPKITETPRRVYIPETPSSRRANQAFKQTVAKLEAEGIPNSRPTPVDANVIIRTATHFPDFLKWEDAHDVKLNNDLKAVLQLQRQRSLDYIDRGEKIVRKISEAIEEKERDFVSNKNEIRHLNNAFNKERNKCLDLERRIMEIESKNSELQIKLISTENIVKSLENEVTEKEQQLSNEQIQVALQKNRFKNKLAQSKEKLAKEMEMKLQEQKNAMEFEMMERDRNMQRRVRRALDTGTSSCTAIIHSAPRSGRPQLLTPSSKPMKSGSDSSSTPVFNRLRKPLQTMPVPQSATSATGSKSVECALDLATPVTVRENRRPQTVAVSNPRHRRSRSAGGGERWLDHCPISSAVPLNTVMQPVMKRRKSITKLTDVKDVANSKVSKYCLTTQTLDSDGDLETCLYKGDIIPTIGGGAQVSFNDMEVLNHKSPQSSPTKSKATPCKSPKTPLLPRDVLEERCAVSYEGHTKRSAI